MIENLKKKVKDAHSEPKSKKNKQALAKPDRYHLFVSENEVIILNTAHPDLFLNVNRETCKTEFFGSERLSKYKMEKPLRIFGIFGRIEINDIEFLVLISKAEVAAKLGDKTIYKVRSVKFLTISKQKYKNFEYEKCWDYLEKMKKFLKIGFFFSYDYSIEENFSYTESGDNKGGGLSKDNDNNVKIETNWDNVFVWNAKAIKPFIKHKAHFSFFIPVVQGFIGKIKAPDFSLTVISKRSYHMGGTRYNSRGIDNNGYVANYVETEQIVESSGGIFVFKQVRGSLPFYWEQKGIKAKVKIHQTLDINVEKFNKHIEIIRKGNDHKHIVMFNLLNNKRSGEIKLTKYFCEVIRESTVKHGIEDLQYDHADFHNINKETDFTNTNKFIYKLYDREKIGLTRFEFDLLSESIEKTKTQKGIIRSNCIDCLDRTNAVQTKFAFLVLFDIMKEIGSEIYNSKYDEDCLLMQEKGEIPFINDFRILWADNGDAISTIYTGTGATTSSVTRKGNKSNITSVFDHGFKTISRFYINNFDDNFKQEVINILLNAKATSILPSTRFFTNSDQIPVKVGVISVVNNRNSPTIQISEKLLVELFKKSMDCNFIIFCSKLSGVKKIQIICDGYQVYESFEFLFKSLEYILQGFKIVNVAESGSSQVLLLAKTEHSKHISFFKYEKAKASTFAKNLGIKSSFILHQYSIELFAISLENQMFSNIQDSMTKLFEKYIDKYYDFIFVVGNIEDGLELDNIHKNYTLVFEEVVKAREDKAKSNQIHLLCAKSLVEKDLEPMYQAIKVDTEGLKGEITVNCHSFIILTNNKK